MSHSVDSIINWALKPLRLRIIRLRDLPNDGATQQLISRHPVGRIMNRMIEPLGMRIIQRKHIVYYQQLKNPEKVRQTPAPVVPTRTVIMSDDQLPLHTINEIFRTLRLPGAQPYEVAIVERDLHVARYNEVVNELCHCFTTYAFPEIPHRDRRVTLLSCLLGTSVAEAMWLLRSLYRALPLEGDVCEFGCAHGSTSALLANEIALTNKSLWLFDSFKGLSKPSEEDVLLNDIFNLGSMADYEGTMAYSPDVVREKLESIGFPENRTHIIPGFIHRSLKSASSLPESVCFAYIDFDLYEPISETLQFLSQRVPVGGHIVVDDYGFLSAGVQKAVDQFVKAQNDTFRLELPPNWAGKFALLIRQ